jgi:hypothetical protein
MKENPRLSRFLLQAVAPARAIAFLATAGVLMTGLKFLVETWWAAILTGAGTLLGFYSVWLTLEIYKIGDHLSQEQAKLLEGQRQVIDEVHRSVMAALKFQHLHDLRRKYDDAEGDEEKRPYWRFAWRFESFDFLGVRIGDSGWARIHIKGCNNRPLDTDADHGQVPIYTVDVLEVRDCEGLTEGRAYCWCPAGEMRISNNADGISVLNPSFAFTISSLGPIRAGSVPERPPSYPRLKDLKSPKVGDSDQG